MFLIYLKFNFNKYLRMGNEFKEFFELTKNFQLQKIHNDFVNSKKFNKNKFLTICVCSLTCFFGIFYTLDFFTNYEMKMKKFRFSMKIKKIAYVSNFRKEKDFDKLENSLERLKILVNMIESEFDLFKQEKSSISYLLKIIKKEVIRMNFYMKNSNINTSSTNSPYNTRDKSNLISIFLNFFDKTNLLIKNDISYLSQTVEILEILVKISKSEDISEVPKFMKNFNKFCEYFITNPDIFHVLFFTDYEMFYKLKKIFINMENLNLIKIKNIENTKEYHDHNHNHEYDQDLEHHLCTLQRIKNLIKSQEMSVDNLLSFV